MEGESAVARSIIDELDSMDTQGDILEGENGVTRGIIHELHACVIQGDQMEGESMVLLEVSLINFILRISNKMKW